MTKAQRDGKVLDRLEPERPRTRRPSASTRCAPGSAPTVSTPLEWEEVEAALAAGDAEALVFDHASVLERVEQRGDLFAPLLSEKQRLPE